MTRGNGAPDYPVWLGEDVTCRGCLKEGTLMMDAEGHIVCTLDECPLPTIVDEMLASLSVADKLEILANGPLDNESWPNSQGIDFDG